MIFFTSQQLGQKFDIYMQDGLFNYRFGVSGRERYCLCILPNFREDMQMTRKIDHKGNGERDIQKGKEGRG